MVTLISWRVISKNWKSADLLLISLDKQIIRSLRLILIFISMELSPMPKKIFIYTSLTWNIFSRDVLRDFSTKINLKYKVFFSSETREYLVLYRAQYCHKIAWFSSAAEHLSLLFFIGYYFFRNSKFKIKFLLIWSLTIFESSFLQNIAFSRKVPFEISDKNMEPFFPYGLFAQFHCWKFDDNVGNMTTKITLCTQTKMIDCLT